MSGLRRRGLQLDDPLGPSRSSHAGESATSPDAGVRCRASENGRVDAGDLITQPRPVADSGRREEEDTSEPATLTRGQNATCEQAGLSSSEVWRAWSGITGVGSFRLPHELLAELGDTARELQLPIGMIVTAAITQLLDQPSHTIAALVDKADDARIQGRRTVRRRLTGRAGG